MRHLCIITPPIIVFAFTFIFIVSVEWPVYFKNLINGMGVNLYADDAHLHIYCYLHAKKSLRISGEH